MALYNCVLIDWLENVRINVSNFCEGFCSVMKKTFTKVKPVLGWSYKALWCDLTLGIASCCCVAKFGQVRQIKPIWLTFRRIINVYLLTDVGIRSL